MGLRAEVSVVEVSGAEAGVCSAGGGVAFFEGCSFLSSETFPMWMGNVNMTSGDFRLT